MAKSQIMYIELKGDDIEGPGRIGWVTFSKTGKTIHYGGKQFQSLKGGYKANFFDIATCERYWISGSKKAGDDTLYSGIIEIDADVQREYWTEIRGLPERAGETEIRSLGKYGR